MKRIALVLALLFIAAPVFAQHRAKVKPHKQDVLLEQFNGNKAATLRFLCNAKDGGRAHCRPLQ